MPEGRTLVTTWRPTVLLTTSSVKAAFAIVAGEEESLTCTVKLFGPTVVGIPEIAPVVLSVKPVGNCPEYRLHLYGEVPPFAERLAAYR